MWASVSDLFHIREGQVQTRINLWSLVKVALVASVVPWAPVIARTHRAFEPSQIRTPPSLLAVTYKPPFAEYRTYKPHTLPKLTEKNSSRGLKDMILANLQYSSSSLSYSLQGHRWINESENLKEANKYKQSNKLRCQIRNLVNSTTNMVVLEGRRQVALKCWHVIHMSNRVVCSWRMTQGRTQALKSSNQITIHPV